MTDGVDQPRQSDPQEAAHGLSCAGWTDPARNASTSGRDPRNSDGHQGKMVDLWATPRTQLAYLPPVSTGWGSRGAMHCCSIMIWGHFSPPRLPFRREPWVGEKWPQIMMLQQCIAPPEPRRRAARMERIHRPVRRGGRCRKGRKTPSSRRRRRGHDVDDAA